MQAELERAYAPAPCHPIHHEFSIINYQLLCCASPQFPVAIQSNLLMSLFPTPFCWLTLILAVAATLPLRGQIDSRGLGLANSGEFIQNRGQWDPQAKFLMQTRQANYWVTSNSIVCDFYQIQRKPTNLRNTNRKELLRQADATVTGHVVEMEFQGSNPAPAITAANPSATVRNYFLGNDPSRWATGVGAFNEVWMRGLYDGVDLRLYPDSGSLRYDFHLAPGVPASRIRFRMANSGGIHIADNQLWVHTTIGSIRHNAPVAYQVVNGQRKGVPCHFMYGGGGIVEFHLGAHDPSLPVVIDPLLYSTYLGGSGPDIGAAIAYDKSGKAYVVGNTKSTNFPTTTGAYRTQLDAGNDVLVSKLSTNGTQLLASTYIGGQGDDVGNGIAVDDKGSVFISGTTSSLNFPTTAGSAQPSYRGSGDMFAAKLDDGLAAINYATYLGGTSTETNDAIAVDGTGAVYLAGTTLSNDYPTAVGSYDVSYNLDNDVVVTKLNAAGSSMVYSTYIGGQRADDATGIAIDASGAAYITGVTQSSDFPTPNGVDKTYNGNADLFVTKVSTTGTALAYSTFVGGTGTEGGGAIAVDENGAAYITGFTNSSDYPTTPGAFDRQRGGQDMIVTKVAGGGGTLSYSTFLGEVISLGFAISVDKAGAAYVTGATYSNTFPTTKNGYDASYNGSGDVIVVKLRSDGSGLLYSSYIGGGSGDVALGNAVDPGGKLFITGWTVSHDYPTTPGAYDTTYNSAQSAAEDAFVTVVPLCESVTLTVADTAICANQSVTVTARATGIGTLTFDWYDITNNKQLSPGAVVSGASSQSLASLTQTTQLQVRVSDGTNCVQTGYITITVRPRPEPPVGDDKIICPGESVRLQAKGEGLATVEWYATATGGARLAPGTTYDTPNLNTTTIFYAQTVDPDGGCTSATRTPITVTVRPRPTVSGVPSPSICAGQSAILSVTPSANATLRWYTVAAGGTPVQLGPSYTTPALSANTTYFVEAYDTITRCTSDPRTLVMVTVRSRPLAPTATFTSACSGEPVTLIATEPQGVQFQWYDQPAGGTLQFTGAQYPVGPVSAARTWYVESVSPGVGAPCVSARTAVTVIVKDRPPAPTISNLTVCRGAAATLAPLPLRDATFRWYDSATGGTMLDSAETFTTGLLTRDTVFYVESFDTASRCVSPTRTAVNIAVADAPSSAIAGPNAACQNSKGIAYGVSARANRIYLWSISSNGTIANGQGTSAITVDWNTAGAGWVGLHEEDTTTKCSSDTVMNVTVAASLAPVITVTGSTTLCQGDSVLLDAGAGYIEYRWSTGDTTQRMMVRQTGSYSVTVRDAGGCSGASPIPINVLVNPLPPAPTIAQTDDTLAAVSTDSIATYQWMLEGASLPGATGRRYAPTTEGRYTVAITDTNGCGGISAPFDYVVLTGTAVVGILPATIQGAPGDIVDVPVVLAAQQNLTSRNATGFTAKLRFNRTLLLPLQNVGLAQGNNRVVEISGTRTEGNDTLAVVRCVVLLGDAQTTPIAIDTFAWAGGKAQATTVAGTFILDGVCLTGDRRLVGQTGALKIVVQPNPAGATAEAVITLTEDGETRATVVDGVGRQRLRLHDGYAKHGTLRLPLPTSAMESGRYYVVVHTPTDVQVVEVEIRR